MPVAGAGLPVDRVDRQPANHRSVTAATTENGLLEVIIKMTLRR
jgi:hypothetical protein